MPTITTKDGAKILYKDWGTVQPFVFSHGWPLTADAWDDQLFFLASRCFRAIAHDRRGHGRSSQTLDGNNIDTYADDLAALAEALDLRNAIHVGHSTGGGEVVRYITRHGTKRVAKAVLIGAIPPSMLETADNPEGLPIDVFDGIRAGVRSDRSQFYKDLSVPFYGANREGSSVSQGVRDAFWLKSMQAGMPAAYDCIKAFSETDFRQELPKIMFRRSSSTATTTRSFRSVSVQCRWRAIIENDQERRTQGLQRRIARADCHQQGPAERRSVGVRRAEGIDGYGGAARQA
jgi:non-heme chloroperoxidase